MARMPRNQLLDQLFALFRETARWSIRPLRERTQQPEAYLKEVLAEIAFLHKSGEYNGLWELKEVFRDEGVRLSIQPLISRFINSSGHQMKAENVPGPSSLDDVKTEMEIDEDDDDDDDDDMEEVS